VTQAAESFDCRKCHGTFHGEMPDNAGWCHACRVKLVKRAALASLPVVLLVAAIYAWILWNFGLLTSTFLIAFIAIGVALAWVAFKVSRRVLFDVLRARAHRRKV
jgi:hypothetical protein